MSMADLTAARELIEAHRHLASFVGPRPERVIVAAEQALGLHFPPTYRRFLLEFGAGNFGGTEIYGVIDDEFSPATPPDAVACTLEERRRRGMPDDLILVGNSGGDELWCLLARSEADEVPVVAVRLDAGGGFQEDAEVIARTFGQFLLEVLQREIAVMDSSQPPSHTLERGT